MTVPLPQQAGSAKSAVRQLEDAVDLLRAGDDEAALPCLLEAWRELRSARLAEGIDRVSDRIVQRRGPVLGKTQSAVLAAWYEIEARRDPCDVGRLLAIRWPAQWRSGERLAQRLAEWPDDPRIALAFARFVAVGVHKEKVAGGFFRLVLKRLSTLRDVRAAELLEATTTDARNEHYRKWRLADEASLIAELRGLPVTTTAESEAGIIALEGLVGTRQDETAKEATLFQAVYDAPDDDEPREVLADWLAQRGDPRGEFISLQLAIVRDPDKVTKAMRGREKALLSEYGRAWAGILDSWLDSAGRVFERGFLGRARLAPKLTGEALKRAMQHTGWATIRELTLTWETHRHFDEVLPSSPLKSLRDLLDVEGKTAARILGTRAKSPTTYPPIEGLGITAFHYLEADELAILAGDTGIRRLTIEGDDLRHFQGSPLLSHLRTLTLINSRSIATQHAQIVSEAPALETLQFGEMGVVAKFQRADHPQLGHVELSWSDYDTLWEKDATDSLIRTIEALAGAELETAIVLPDSRWGATALHRTMVDEALTKLKQGVRVELPWATQPSSTHTEEDRAAGSVVLLELEGAELKKVGVASRVVERYLASGASLDAYAVRRNSWARPGLDIRPIGKNPAATIDRAAGHNNSAVRVFRHGSTAWLELPSWGRSKFAFGGIDDLASADKLVDWICSFLEEFPTPHGMARVLTDAEVTTLRERYEVDKSGSCTIPALTWLRRGPADRAWLTIFGEKQRRLFPFDELLRIGDRVSGASARSVGDNVLIRWSRLPRVFDDEGSAVIDEALLTILRAAFERSYGYDPFVDVPRALAAAAARIGLSPKPVSSALFGCFVLSGERHGRGVEVYATVREVENEPRLHAYVHVGTRTELDGKELEATDPAQLARAIDWMVGRIESLSD
ncbi:MAG: TIGR02996 domain-containing protein [Polyangiaceae bacterium]